MDLGGYLPARSQLQRHFFGRQRYNAHPRRRGHRFRAGSRRKQPHRQAEPARRRYLWGLNLPYL